MTNLIGCWLNSFANLPSKSMLTVGIIGLGVGEKYIQTLDNQSKVYLKTLCDFDENKITEFEKKYPDKQIVNDSNIVMSDNEINFVAIASYDNYHVDQIVSALNNKKHVFVEKPLCLRINEMHKIRSALKNNPEMKISSNLVLRSVPLFKKLKNDILSKLLGDVYFIEADYLWGRIYKLDGWRSKMNYYSIIHGAAIHMIDLIMWFLDEKPIEVKTYGNNIATKNYRLNYNSFAVMLLKYKSGLVVKISSNGGCVHPHFHSVKIFGTKKTVYHELNGSNYIKNSDNKFDFTAIDEPYPAKDERQNILISFIDSLTSDRDPIVRVEDIFDAMSISFSAEKSMLNVSTEKIKYYTNE